MQSEEIESSIGATCDVVGLQLEAADKGGNGGASLRSGSTVFSPAGLEGVGDDGALLAGEGEVCFDGPGVSVLWVQRGGFVVAVQSGFGVPEELVGGGLHACSDAGPLCGGGGLVELLGEGLGILEDEVED